MNGKISLVNFHILFTFLLVRVYHSPTGGNWLLPTSCLRTKLEVVCAARHLFNRVHLALMHLVEPFRSRFLVLLQLLRLLLQLLLSLVKVYDLLVSLLRGGRALQAWSNSVVWR